MRQTSRSAITAVARAVEEGAALFAGFHAERRAEGDRAQDRHRHDLALGHDALHVVDPGRHQHHVGEHLRQRVEARLELLRLAGVAARAFGKDDDRVAALQRVDQRLQRRQGFGGVCRALRSRVALDAGMRAGCSRRARRRSR